MERFLITGLPRIRSAWLTALLTALGVGVTHESQTGPPFVGGWCDPSAACLWPHVAAKWAEGCPIVVIDRSPHESRASWEKWTGVTLGNWREICTNVAQFKRLVNFVALRVPYEDMDNYDTVAKLVKHCTGKYLPRHMWGLFNELKIEQHLAKAQARGRYS